MKPRAAPSGPNEQHAPASEHAHAPAALARDSARGADALSPAGAIRAAPAVVALSEDAGLLEALSIALRGQAAVVTAPSADRFADQLVAMSAAVALIDAAVAPAPLTAFIADVHRQFPQLLLLLAGPASLQIQFAAQLADGTLFRFAHKPVSAQRLKLFVDAALLRQQSLIDLATLASLPPGTPAAAAASLGPNPFVHSGRRRPLWVMASILAGLIAAALGAVLWRRPPVQPSPAVESERDATDRPPTDQAATGQAATGQAATVQAATDQGADEQAERDLLVSEHQAREAALADELRRAASGARVDQAHVYVQLAQKRLASAALLEPADDSAHAYVQAAMSLAPDDADVRAVAVAFGEALIAKFHAAVAAGQADAAAHWLQACRDYRINDATLGQLGTQLDALRRAPTAPSAVVLALQRDFDQHLSKGQLLEPADENALTTYRRLKAADPDNAALPLMLRALRSAVAADLQARIAAQDLVGATQRLHAALAEGLDGEELVSAAAALERAQAAAAREPIPEAKP
jgi:hypothetical protein